MRRSAFAAAGLSATLWAVLATGAAAQAVGGFPQGTYPGLYNPYGMMGQNSGFMPGMNGMNGMPSQQLGAMMGMRMLQGMGGFHGVQTGVANPIMGGGFGSQPQLYYDGPPSPGSGTSTSKSKGGSQSKREAARAQRAEEKRLAAAAKAKPKAEKKTRKPKDQQ